MRKTTFKVLIAILLGALIGDVIGEILRIALPPSAAKEIILHPVQFGFSPFTIDFVIAKFTIGLTVDFNILAALFVALMIFLLMKF